MILKEYFQIVVNFYVKQFDSSILSLQGMFRAVGLRCVLYCSQVILLWRVWVRGGGSARHHMQVQSKES